MLKTAPAREFTAVGYGKSAGGAHGLIDHKTYIHSRRNRAGELTMRVHISKTFVEKLSLFAALGIILVAAVAAV